MKITKPSWQLMPFKDILSSQNSDADKLAALLDVSKMLTSDAYRQQCEFAGGHLIGAFIWENSELGWDFWNEFSANLSYILAQSKRKKKELQR